MALVRHGIVWNISSEKRKTCAYFEHVIFDQIIVSWEVTFVRFCIRNGKKVPQFLKEIYFVLISFPILSKF